MLGTTPAGIRPGCSAAARTRLLPPPDAPLASILLFRCAAAHGKWLRTAARLSCALGAGLVLVFLALALALAVLLHPARGAVSSWPLPGTSVTPAYGPVPAPWHLTRWFSLRVRSPLPETCCTMLLYPHIPTRCRFMVVSGISRALVGRNMRDKKREKNNLKFVRVHP